MATHVDDVLRIFKKWLYVKEDYNVTGPMCSGIANFCPGEPDIIGVIGPSGSLKTEVIRSFGNTENQYVYPVSTLTDKTLVSGFRKSNDIVPRLNSRLLTIKDLTSILSKNEDIRAGIFADFREMTDGYIRKEFGNGIIKEYHNIHSSILFASTNSIERYYSLQANLGQRIIFLRPKNDPIKARERSVENRGKEKEMREEIHIAVINLVGSIAERMKEGATPPSASDEIRKEMGGFYDFLALARTPLHRNYRGEIDSLPEPEFPTRIANTISRLCEVHAMVYDRHEVQERDVAFAVRIIADNVPTMRWQVLKALNDDWMPTPLIKADQMSTGSIRYALEELEVLKLVERKSREEHGGRSDSYRLTDWTALQLERLRTKIRYSSSLEVDNIEQDVSSSPEFSTQLSEETAPESCGWSAFELELVCS